MRHDLTPSDIERFWSKVDCSGGPDACHPWQGTPGRNGYGRFSIGHGEELAHRVAWVIAHGPIPDGLCVCHDCPNGDNRLCMNDRHMFLGTRGDNNSDRARKGRSAYGDRSGVYTHPEVVKRGTDAWAHLNRERLARGERHGTHTRPETVRRGSDNGNSRLTWDMVRAIRQRYADGGVSQTALALEFQIDQTTISCIVRQQTWRE